MSHDLNERSRDVLRRVVETYMETGQPVGSRTLSRRLTTPLSPATIRNVMADLEDAGLLYAPHTSAGRLPTQLGLRLFVDGLLELGELTEAERASIDGKCQAAGRTLDELLTEASDTLSGLSHCASLVLAPKTDLPFRQVEFVSLGPGRALVVMVMESGIVENRVIDVPSGMTQSHLIEATNYLNARLAGRTLAEALGEIRAEVESKRAQLDALAAKVVEAGIATWSGEAERHGALIVRGQAKLLDDVTVAEDLERIRALYETLESKTGLVSLLESTRDADGVKIFIGAESKLFGNTECSLIVSPFRSNGTRFVGAIGVVGPTRLNYARIIPMVSHTAEIIGRLLS
ncbi:MAG: heat-inducible transcriptional repressor HrcA [Alphaproteobacteria bacterium]